MSLSHEELTALHAKATENLLHKLSRVPARVWLADFKPTTRDIYNDSEHVYIASVPNECPIWFISDNFEQIAAQDFQVRKREGDMNVNMAIWYYQMEVHHSFSSVHWTSRYNVIMAVVVVVTGMLGTLKGGSLDNFVPALIRAFRESVTKQVDTKHKENFLSIWAAGQFDYIYWGKKGRSEMHSTIRALEQAPHVAPFDRESSMDNFWNIVECEKPRDRKKYGARWAVHHVMYLERIGKVIELDDKRIEADCQLKNNLLVQQFASGSLDAGADGAAERVFASPHIQALLRDAQPVNKSPNDTKREDMWMDPDEALGILREDDAVRRAMAEEEEKRMQKALQDMADLSTSSVALGQSYDLSWTWMGLPLSISTFLMRPR